MSDLAASGISSARTTNNMVCRERVLVGKYFVLAFLGAVFYSNFGGDRYIRFFFFFCCEASTM